MKEFYLALFKPLPKRVDGKEHLSECLLFIDPTAYCTCFDDSPDWD